MPRPSDEVVLRIAATARALGLHVASWHPTSAEFSWDLGRVERLNTTEVADALFEGGWAALSERGSRPRAFTLGEVLGNLGARLDR